MITQKNMVYFSPQFIALFGFGFFSGLPLALSGGTLQVWFAASGVSVVAIGALSLVAQPYVYKFLWAPLLDHYFFDYLDARRSWIVIFQALLAAILFVMSLFDPQQHLYYLIILAVVLSLCSASQDIVMDAYRTELLAPKMRGLGASFATTGYRLAMLVSGGVAMVLADQLGWVWVYRLMAGLMLLGILVTLVSPKLAVQRQRATSLRSAMIEPLRQLSSQPQAWITFAVVISYKLGDAFALSLSSTFLLKGVGFSLTQIAGVYKGAGFLATLLGCFVGGALLTRWRLLPTLIGFGVLQMVSIFPWLVLAVIGKQFILMLFSVVMESFCSGLGSVAFMAFLMRLCVPGMAGAQFALLSALASVGRVFIGPLAGLVALHYGWPAFFFCAMLAAIPAVLLLCCYNRGDFFR